MLFCQFKFSNQFATDTSGFNVNWMLHQTDHELFLAQQDLALILNETAIFLSPPKPPKSTSQGGGSSVGLAALAAVALFVGGLAVGDSDSCRSLVIFASCQDQSKANAENVRRFADFQKSLCDYTLENMTHMAEKNFHVENELAALNAIQSEMAATQDKNWDNNQEQAAIYEKFFHILKDCDDLLFAKQQVNFILIPFLLYFQ